MQLKQVSANASLANDSLTQIEVSGEIAHLSQASAEPLAATFGEDIYRRNVVLSLNLTTYLDSSGIGWLIATKKRFGVAGGKLVLLQPPPLVLNVLKVANLVKFLAVANTHEEAAKMLSQQEPTP